MRWHKAISSMCGALRSPRRVMPGPNKFETKKIIESKNKHLKSSDLRVPLYLYYAEAWYYFRVRFPQTKPFQISRRPPMYQAAQAGSAAQSFDALVFGISATLAKTKINSYKSYTDRRATRYPPKNNYPCRRWCNTVSGGSDNSYIQSGA